ncbi:MAG TPA: hypothetical protein PLX23_06185 [Candidatus Hydrogenedens sp.]|nr:hypothetical protein [Candidatus Hydrogenedens sp.]
MQDIDKYLDKELNEYKKDINAEDLLKRARELQNLLDYAIKKEDKELFNRIMVLIEDIYKEGLLKYPDNIKIYDNYGSFLYDYKKDYITSVELWEKGYNLNPKDASMNNNLAIHYFYIGEYDKGWDYLQKALKYGNDEPNILYNSAQIFIIHRDQIQEKTGWDKKKIYQKAMEYSERAAKLQPDDFELCKDYALNFFAAVEFNLPVDGKKCATAWQNARKLARTKDEEFYTRVNEGRAWLAIYKLDNAKKCLLEALKIRPDSIVVKNILSQIESGEIKENIENEKRESKKTTKDSESKNPFISPFKNYSGKKRQKTMLQQMSPNASKSE